MSYQTELLAELATELIANEAKFTYDGINLVAHNEKVTFDDDNCLLWRGRHYIAVSHLRHDIVINQ